MKYLGMIIDCRWNYREHAKYAADKANLSAMSLAKLMPNLVGPSFKQRKLYETVIRSILLYAVPVWSDIFKSGRIHWAPLVKVSL